MIGMVGNHLLEMVNWLDHANKNINALAPRPAVSYFQKKRDDEVVYTGMEIILNSINKDSSILTIDQILSPSTIRGHFLNSYFTQ